MPEDADLLIRTTVCFVWRQELTGTDPLTGPDVSPYEIFRDFHQSVRENTITSVINNTVHCYDDKWMGSGAMFRTEENQKLVLVPAPLFLLRIPLGRAWDRTRACMGRGQEQIAWTMARPVHVYFSRVSCLFFKLYCKALVIITIFQQQWFNQSNS